LLNAAIDADTAAGSLLAAAAAASKAKEDPGQCLLSYVFNFCRH
jgi:hypothetical protein